MKTQPYAAPPAHPGERYTEGYGHAVTSIIISRGIPLHTKGQPHANGACDEARQGNDDGYIAAGGARPDDGVRLHAELRSRQTCPSARYALWVGRSHRLAIARLCCSGAASTTRWRMPGVAKRKPSPCHAQVLGCSNSTGL